MDIFEVLTAISKKKKALMHSGINEHEALIKAELDVSEEYRMGVRLRYEMSRRSYFLCYYLTFKIEKSLCCIFGSSQNCA